MTNHLKLLCVLAHPDDESLGNGGILARYAAEGVETYLVTATRGERGDERDYPGLEVLGKRREAELLAAAKVLGIRRVEFLDYLDGDLDQAPAASVVAKIALYLRRVKPDVVSPLDPMGDMGILITSPLASSPPWPRRGRGVPEPVERGTAHPFAAKRGSLPLQCSRERDLPAARLYRESSYLSGGY
jgi:hypothetical protein